MQNEDEDNNFIILAAAQDTGGIEVAAPWYSQAEASFVALVDESHTISSLYNLVNVPSAVWIDEEGTSSSRVDLPFASAPLDSSRPGLRGTTSWCITVAQSSYEFAEAHLLEVFRESGTAD